MESIEDLRQMMAEQKYLEVQKKVELQLSQTRESRYELLQIYFEILENQKKEMVVPLILELAEFEINNKHFEVATNLLNRIRSKKFYSRVMRFKMLIAESRGQLDLLNNLLNQHLLFQMEKQIPSQLIWINSYVDKYFKDDFPLRVKLLGISLLTDDIIGSEKLLKSLLRFCMESSSLKGKSEKVQTILSVLKLRTTKDVFDIYQNFCEVYLNGVESKTDFKKLVEMVIYFEDFNFQVFVLDILHKSDMAEEAKLQSAILRKHVNYDFVYLDKYFHHLKSYFISANPESPSQADSSTQVDLTIEETVRPVFEPDERELEFSEEEAQLIVVLKYQSYSPEQLCDISVSFLQSEMFKAALVAADLAMSRTKDTKLILKASYLKYTSELQLKDYRAALDTALEALTHSTESTDIISFLYAQAEAHIKLRQYQESRVILRKVLEIDPAYRMARERLEKLNEI